MSFDLTIAFDKTEYLDPQIYMYIDTLKDNIPKDCILHITTNRDRDDKILKWIEKQIPCKIYIKPHIKELKSRCRYLIRAFEIETDKEWIIKTDLDILFLNKVKRFNKLLEDDVDVAIQSENRRIITNDDLELRIWRNIYRAMGIKLPNIKIPYVEDKQEGLPLLNTGVVCIRSKFLDVLKERWIPLTKICEKWIDYGIHPNEFAFTGITFDEGWNIRLFNKKYNFNPIGHFRKGEFPSIELNENCKLQSDIILLHYHKPQWLLHLGKSNNNINDIIERHKKYIPKDWWDLDLNTFLEK